jgi:hypothetical protein
MKDAHAKGFRKKTARRNLDTLWHGDAVMSTLPEKNSICCFLWHGKRNAFAEFAKEQAGAAVHALSSKPNPYVDTLVSREA